MNESVPLALNVTRSADISNFKNVLEPKWLEVDFSFWGSDEAQKISMSELQFAIINKQIIEFDYINSDLYKSKRIVEPLQMLFKSHAWYIVGFCRSKQDIRIFRLSRMKKIQVTEELFERELPPDYSIMPGCQENLQIPVMKLKFSPEIAGRVYDEFQEEDVTPCADGSYLVTAFHYDMNNWTFNRLLSYGKYVEVIEPEEARAMLKKQALEIADIYN